jgi:hypothetical protein
MKILTKRIQLYLSNNIEQQFNHANTTKAQNFHNLFDGGSNRQKIKER